MDSLNATNLDVFLFTFNCGKNGLGDTFVSKVSKILPQKPAALYVFGIQEACSVMDGSYDALANRHFIDINETLLETLKSAHSDMRFATVGMCHIGAIGLFVITPFSLQIVSVKLATAACGYFNSTLKGAAGLRVKYRPLGESKTVDLTFASAHLSAYEGEFYQNRRNDQVLKLMRAMDFGDGYSFLKPGSHAFFLGDLNYRTVHDIRSSAATVDELLSLQDQTMVDDIPSIEDLVQKYDELSQSIRDDQVFMGFTEACIKFPPTYKYNVGTAIYNDKRSPSWCDRILYQSTYTRAAGTRKSDQLPRINEYNSCKTLFSSDHQPVYLSITLPFSPPESIVSSSGYMKILPNDQMIDHFHRKLSTVFTDTASGPTQIYVKSTTIDRLISYYITPFANLVIGNSLWLSTTSTGRLSLLVVVLILGTGYAIFR